MGEAGVGKETIIQHLAFRLIKDEVPKALFDKRLVSLEIQNLIAGAAPEELGARIAKSGRRDRYGREYHPLYPRYP